MKIKKSELIKIVSNELEKVLIAKTKEDKRKELEELSKEELIDLVLEVYEEE